MSRPTSTTTELETPDHLEELNREHGAHLPALASAGATANDAPAESWVSVSRDHGALVLTARSRDRFSTSFAVGIATVLFGGFALALSVDFPWFFKGFFLLAASLFGLIFLSGFFNRTTLTVSGQHLHIERGPVRIGKRLSSFPISNLGSLSVEDVGRPGGNMPLRHYLRANLVDGTQVNLMDVKSRDEGAALIQCIDEELLRLKAPYGADDAALAADTPSHERATR